MGVGVNCLFVGEFEDCFGLVFQVGCFVVGQVIGFVVVYYLFEYWFVVYVLVYVFGGGWFGVFVGFFLLYGDLGFVVFVGVVGFGEVFVVVVDLFMDELYLVFFVEYLLVV